MSLNEKRKMKEIKLRSQPKWLVRMFILVGAILGGVLAFLSHPIGGTNAQSVDCPEGQYLATGNVCITDDKDIVIQATATEANQTLTINKYFASAYTVDRGDGMTGDLTVDTIHTYDVAGVYDITLSLSGADRWTFRAANKPLVPTSGTTMTGVKIIYMPSLAEGFGNSATNPGNYFFRYFNYNGALTSLPEGSFDTSNITVVGNQFFYSFNRLGGQLTSLPEGSFDTSNITVAGLYFFSNFNQNGALTNLPRGSFNISNIASVGNDFFRFFNSNGALISLPEGSFKFSTGLTIVGDYFFQYFNNSGALLELPEGSFNTENITTVGVEFFCQFNTHGGQLTSLPEGSFKTTNISGTVGDGFFWNFNREGNIISLPEGSFDVSNITSVGSNFFRSFNAYGALTSLPEGSFDTSNITVAGLNFFSNFNQNGAITSLPEGSFDMSNITTAGDYFFGGFNREGNIISLPEGSFDMSNITTAGDYFFDWFNESGAITTLPNSFKMSSVGASVTGGYSNAFNSPSYTLNKNVLDLVSGVTAPLDSRYTFSDNQPGRCGVDPNWLVSTIDVCGIIYDSNVGSLTTITKKYTADTTGVDVGDGVAVPVRDGFIFDGWYTDPDGGELVEIVTFPSMDGDTLYAHWALSYTVTFNANGGTTSQTTQTLAENTSINLPNASRDGYEFLGWYTEETGGIRIGGYNDPYIVVGDTTLYAHWSEVLLEGIFFETGDITYTDTNGKVFSGIGTVTIRSGGKTITILDRNLGATTNDITKTGSYGYYFQWGNNYGFSMDDGFNTSSTAIKATNNSWNNPYVSGVFITATYWDKSYNPELWGGSDDYDTDRGIDTSDNGYARQGPCPAGYHVPSIGEFDELMRLTKSITGGTVQLQTNDNGNLVESNPFVQAFTSELHIPIAGYIGLDGVYTGISESAYSYGYFWSSSFKKANGYLMVNHHPIASKKDKVSTRGSNLQQGNAFSIRCFKNTAEEGDEIVLSYDTRDGSAIQAQTLPVGGIGYLPGYTTHRVDADLLGWYEGDLLTEIDLANTVLTGDTTIYAKWSDDYTVQFLDFDGSTLKTEVVRSGSSAIAPVNPIRNGYTFVGWDLDFSSITGDLVVTAQYSKNQSAGGGGNSLKRDNCPDGDYSDSYYDGSCGKKPTQNDEDKDFSDTHQNDNNQHHSADEIKYDTLTFNPHYTDEMNMAYQYAYHYGITTKNNIKDAAMNQQLTRIAMAKMLSQYAINVLGIKPDTSRNNQFTDVPEKMDTEYNDGVTLAYQLGIMGINMPNNEFRPYGYVTRAEFATALSRLLYDTPDGIFEGTSKYYTPHISKLAYEGILTNTDPHMKELRGYVMLMLMRSAK